jgi:hypothetical protein
VAVKVIELFTPLPPDACEARLREATDREGPQAWFGSRPVISWISLRSVQIRKRVAFRNSFQTYLVCSLAGGDGGTRLRVEVGLHPLLPVFLTVSCVVVGLAGVGLLIAGVRAQFVGGSTPLYVAVLPFGMLAFAFGLVRFGRWLARGEDQFLITFLEGVIGAPRGVTASERGTSAVWLTDRGVRD